MVCLPIFLIIGVLFDFEKDKLPNLLCLSGAILGLLFNWSVGGAESLILGLEGAALMLGILLPLWMFHCLGGGDVKFMMMAGCYLGVQDGLFLLITTAICTGVYGFILLVVRGNLKERMILFLSYCYTCMKAGTRLEYPFDPNSDRDRKEAGIHVSYGVLGGYVIFCLKYLSVMRADI